MLNKENIHLHEMDRDLALVMKGTSILEAPICVHVIQDLSQFLIFKSSFQAAETKNELMYITSCSMKSEHYDLICLLGDTTLTMPSPWYEGFCLFWSLWAKISQTGNLKFMELLLHEEAVNGNIL